SATTGRAAVGRPVTRANTPGSGYGTAPPESLRGIRTVTSRCRAHARRELACLLRRRRRRRPRELARLSSQVVATAAEQLESDQLEGAASLLAVGLVVRPFEDTQRALERRQLLLRSRRVRTPVLADPADGERDRERDQREEHEEQQPQQPARRERARPSGGCEL